MQTVHVLAIITAKSGQRDRILKLFRANVPAVHAAYHRLLEADIVVSLREDAIRVSPHIYNTREDMDRVLEILAETL